MEHSILNGGCVIVICAMTLWLLFRVRKLHSQFGIINAVYCLGIILVILCAAAILIGPMNLENIYHDIKHPPEPEQIESSPMRELLAGETTLLLDNRGCGYIPGDIVIINGDTSQIRPGDCILFDWNEALSSGRLGACLGGYGPRYTIVKIVNIPGDTLAISLPAYDGVGARVFRLGGPGWTGTNNSECYTLAANEFVIEDSYYSVTPGVILITDALIHAKIVMKIGHDAAAAREFSDLTY